MKLFKRLVLAILLIGIGASVSHADKVVVIPLDTSSAAGTSDKLWGQARPGTKLSILMDTVAGVEIRTSRDVVPWTGAAAACPADTWVCSSSDVAGADSTGFGSYTARHCDGTTALDSQHRWLSDTVSVNGHRGMTGETVHDFVGFDVYYFFIRETQPKCLYLSVMCCSN